MQSSGALQANNSWVNKTRQMVCQVPSSWLQVIIGDEILAAKVEDTNTKFLCSELRAIGWQVCRASGDKWRGGLSRGGGMSWGVVHACRGVR